MLCLRCRAGPGVESAAEGAPVMGRDKRLGTGGSASPGLGIQRRK